MEAAKYTVYILKCANGTLYTGITNDLPKRVLTHESGKGSKYVRAHLPFTVVHTEIFDTKVEAMRREYEIKQWSREKKITQLGINEAV
jgi:putative endonuclease